jgi:hypothetical protein
VHCAALMGLRFFLGVQVKLFLLTILGACAWSSSAWAVSGGVKGTVYSHSQTSFTDSSVGPPVAGATIYLSYCRQWNVPALHAGWTCSSVVTRQTTTDENGNYSIWVTDAMNDPGGTKTLGSVGILSGGDETVGASAILTFNGSWLSARNFFRVPLMRSPNGAMWLRKYGTGQYPFFFVEGFDPENATKTGDEMIPGNNSTSAASPSILRIIRNSPVADGQFFGNGFGVYAGADWNMLDYLLAHNYSIYIIASGSNWQNSQSGTLADHSDGMAYQAMALIKKARDRFAPTAPIILGGYSLGGSIVRTGLVHWCKGDFASIAGSALTSGCPEVGLWWAADAPLDSATVPESLIRLMKDPGLSAATTGPYKVSMNSAAARELLETWTTDGCTTTCVDKDGCLSANSGFYGGCVVDNRTRVNFQTWNGMNAGRTSSATHAQLESSLPKRGGTLVPAVAFSMGRAPNFGFLSNAMSTSAVQLNGQTRFMRVHIHGTASLFGIDVGSSDNNVDLYAKWEELRTGSRLNSLGTLQTAGTVPGDSSGWGTWTTRGDISNPTFDFYPTFIPARSSLLWSGVEANSPTYWKDWRANNTDANHFSPFPNNETGMVLAWVSEYMKGQRTAPVATKVKTPNLQSRPPSKEIINGIDDDGDDEIDELQVHEGPGMTASWADASNRYVTFVSQNRYWKYDNQEEEFLPQTGYFGQGNFVPDVPMGSATTWRNAPLVNGQRPWDGLGITAAYTAPATSDGDGAAQFIVLFSRDKYWVYRAGWNGVQSWIAAGWVGDGQWLPGVLPYFEASYTPDLNGWKPWQLAGITGIHYDEWGRADTLQIASEDRTWLYRFSDYTWTPLWLRGGIMTAAWTTLDRSVQCIASNNPCTWLDCGSNLYSDGGFTHASCFTMQGGWTPRNTFDISAWASQIAQVQAGVVQTSFWSSGCSLGVATNIAPTCYGKQICNYPLPAGCGGTVSYTCSTLDTNWLSATAPSGGTLVLSCL